MTFYDRLLQETAPARADFLAIPALAAAIEQGVPRELYVAYLSEAYHHVKYTVRLLALALARTGDADAEYQRALVEYIDEEKGHETWILDDIRAMGGDSDAVRRGRGGFACRTMIGYMHYAIEHLSPYAMLGMVHVLEGISVMIADKAAKAIRAQLGAGTAGFSYLTSHGGLDVSHVAFFRQLVDGIADPAQQAVIIDTANVIYRLFGDMFRDLGRKWEQRANAA